jgi:hypothetical protein
MKVFIGISLFCVLCGCSRHSAVQDNWNVTLHDGIFGGDITNVLLVRETNGIISGLVSLDPQTPFPHAGSTWPMKGRLIGHVWNISYDIFEEMPDGTFLDSSYSLHLELRADGATGTESVEYQQTEKAPGKRDFQIIAMRRKEAPPELVCIGIDPATGKSGRFPYLEFIKSSNKPIDPTTGMPFALK